MEALDHEIRRAAITAHHRIHSRRQSVLERTGVQPDSSELIRELRSDAAHYGLGFSILVSSVRIPGITNEKTSDLLV